MAVKNTWMNGETVRAVDMNALATEANSGIKRIVTTFTNSGTVGSKANTDYVALISSGNVTLPTAVGNTSRITLKNISSVNRFALGTGGQTIDGSVTVALTPNTSIDVVSDGSNWVVI